MAFLYVYSPSDFVTGIPDEVSGLADGTPVFTLTLKADATPTVIEVTDNDTIFNEINAVGATQTLTSDVTIDGNFFAAGTTINAAYDLLNSGSGHKVTTFHFGGDGYQQGAVDGLVSTVSLQPGVSYTFDSERTSYTQNNLYTDYVACFTTGTLIETDAGPVPIEELRSGDRILTADHDFQKVKWIMNQTVPAIGALAPVVLPKGSIGNTRDLVLSPQHRILIENATTELLFEQYGVFISAKQLAAAGRGYSRPGGMVTYYHMVFDRHEIVFSEGTPTESFLPGNISHLPEETQAEFTNLFPEFLNASTFNADTARYCLKGYEARVLLAA